MKHIRKCYTEHIQNVYEIRTKHTYFVFILYMFSVTFSHMFHTKNLYIFFIFFIRKIIGSLTEHNIRKNQQNVSKNSLSLGLVAYTDNGK